MSSAKTFDQETLRFYGKEAPVYAAAGPAGTSRHLLGFLELLKPGARILELGCGGGRDSAAMLAQGFDVDVTDAVPEIARKAEERIGRPVKPMRFDELHACEEYDAVWANASLLHVPREGLTGILSLIYDALKPGGYHFASYKGGGTEGRDRFGRYFNYLSREQVMAAYVAAAAWQIVSIIEYEGGGYEGGSGPWVAVTLKE